MEQAEAQRLTSELIQAVNERDIERAIALVHPDVVLTPLVVQAGVVPEPYRGIGQAREYFAAFSSFWGNAIMRLDAVQTVESVVIAFCELEDGANPSLPVTYVTRLQDGLLREMASFADPDRVRAALHGRAAAGAVRPLDVSLSATPESVSAARHAVSAFLDGLGADTALHDQVALSVSEAVGNAVLHAYRDMPEDARGAIRVQADASGSSVMVRISDDGCGLLPRSDSPGLGLGIALMNRHAAELAFVGPPERAMGTEVRMRFGLGHRLR